MMLTREEAIAEFRKMWNWIADETEELKRIVNKREYFDAHGLQVVMNECWLCHYNDQAEGGGCEACPIDFGFCIYVHEDLPCLDANEGDTPFSRWCDCLDIYDWESAAKNARQIANLPERVVEG